MVTKMRIRRVQMGLSQVRLSIDTGVDQARISLVERLLVQPKDDERNKLAEVLRMDPSTLLESVNEVEFK